MSLHNNLPSGKLSYDKKKGWLIFSSEHYFKLSHDIIKDIGLKKHHYYLLCSYHFNKYDELCVWLDETEFSLSRSFIYEIVYLPIGYS